MSELIKRLRDYQIGDVADYVERHPEICDEAAARIAELEAAVTDCHAGHTAIERGYLARIAELESADAMITNTCDLVARLETLEAAINNVIEISDKFPSSAPGLTPYNIEYRNGWDDAAGILREALEATDGEART